MRTPRADRLYPVARHWYTGRYSASDAPIVDKADRLRALPRGVRRLALTEHHSDEYGHAVMTFRVPAAAMRAPIEVLAELLEPELMQAGLNCGCEHDCCGHRSYRTAVVIRRKRREVTVRQGWVINI